jgi:hypothetical protein
VNDIASGYWILIPPLAPLLIPLPIFNDGCYNAYAVPIDFVSIYMFGAPAFYRMETVKPPYLATPTLCILSNNPNIPSMKYVFMNYTISSWPAKFCEAMVFKLASKICFKISNAAELSPAIKKEYDAKIISAIAADSNKTSPDEAIANEWFIARLSGSTGAVGLGPDNNNVGFYW